MAKRYRKTIEYIKIGKTKSGKPSARLGFGGDLWLNAMGEDYNTVKELSQGALIEFEIGMSDDEPVWCNKISLVDGNSAPAPDPDEFDPFADPPSKGLPRDAPKKSTAHTGERTEKDTLIVNQSSLARAVEYGVANKCGDEEVLQLAQKFADWVFNYEPKSTFQIAEE